MHKILITGTSSGIGQGLAKAYLERGAKVFGMSRRDAALGDAYRHASIDLCEHSAVAAALDELLGDCNSLDLVVLNAGVLPRFGDLRDADLDEAKRVMEINLWAPQSLMQALVRSGRSVGQVVAISSGAAVNGHRGWGAYSLSKAALNMLVQLWAAELAETHVSALAPGLVDTAMQDYLCGLDEDLSVFPSLAALKERRGGPEMPSPDAAATKLVEVMAKLPQAIPSGGFADVRQLEGFDARST